MRTVHRLLDGSLSREGESALLATPCGTSTSLFAMPHARTRYVAGIWTRVVAEFDVEIAENAAITDPIVYSFVAGDLFEVASDGVSSMGDLYVGWSAVRAFESEPKPVVVRKDINGVRSEEQSDHIDVVRHRVWSSRLVVGDETPAEIRLLPDAAEVDLWSRD